MAYPFQYSADPLARRVRTKINLAPENSARSALRAKLCGDHLLDAVARCLGDTLAHPRVVARRHAGTALHRDGNRRRDDRPAGEHRRG